MIAHTEAALRLSPRARVGNPLSVIGRSYFFARRFNEAVPKLLLAIQEGPSNPHPYRALAACVGDDPIRAMDETIRSRRFIMLYCGS